MQVIPVLDIKGGIVVLAIGGHRAEYHPINTPLCPNCTPHHVIDAFLNLYPFRFFYVADLDAIEGTGTNREIIHEICNRQPHVEIWLDAGISRTTDLDDYEFPDNLKLVIGSESLKSLEDYRALKTDPRLTDHILSLDRKDATELGTSDIILAPQEWPQTVIAMELTDVGRSNGPNFRRIAELQGAKAGISVVASGGVRNFDDLLALTSRGVNSALVATALHHQVITQSDLLRLTEL